MHCKISQNPVDASTVLTSPTTDKKNPEGAAAGSPHLDGYVLGGGGEHFGVLEDSINFQNTGTSIP